MPSLPQDWFGDKPPWRVPPEHVAPAYPALLGGVEGRVHFMPAGRPNVVDRAFHILFGDDQGGGHLDDFRGWTPGRVMTAVDEALADPYSIERRGSQYVFRRLIDGVPLEVLVAARKVAPTLHTAYPAWQQLSAIRAGRFYQALRWGPWPE